jgi:[acyl-carrier-protein] S-malonyltransferase
MVVAFVGFMGGWNGSGTLSAGVVAALVVVWFTFLPSFLFILAGGPLVEASREDLRVGAPLTAITAAVVGVILSLALYLAGPALAPNGALDAGAVGFEDAVGLVDVRGRAMQECAEQRPGAMLAVLGVDRDKLVALCDECRAGDVLEVANVLCPGNIVASGSKAAVGRLEAAALAAGAMKCVPLEVAGAFHTALMQPAVERLTAALAAAEFRAPRIPVVSNVDARPHTDPAEIKALLARQVVGVVEWNASMAYILSTGVRSIWEVGPGRVLRGLMKRIDRSVACSGVFD